MKKILIVEDEAITALSFKNFLEDKGYDCYVFHSGEDALKKIETIKFDLAILDIKLRDKVTGLEVGEKLKEYKTPLIFISAFSDSENYTKAQKLEPHFVFSKPVGLDILLRKVENILTKDQLNEMDPIL